MSTESGLPDFRSAAGIWQEVDPTEVATIDAFRRDPERVWGWYGPRIRSFLDVEPNPGHRALAALERAGLVQAVVTQNIDTLHTRAGSVNVVEVHGSIRRAICLTCGAPEPLEGVLEQLEQRAGAALPHVRRGAQAGRRPLRRAAAARRARTRRAAGPGGRAAAGRRLLTAGVARGGAAGADAREWWRRRDPEPRADPVRRPGDARRPRAGGSHARRGCESAALSPASHPAGLRASCAP